jgi:hypothetical protein
MERGRGEAVIAVRAEAGDGVPVAATAAPVVATDAARARTAVMLIRR